MKAESKTAVFSWRILGQISRVAVPSILQQSFVSVGNIIIQGMINSFGPDAESCVCIYPVENDIRRRRNLAGVAGRLEYFRNLCGFVSASGV